MSADNSREKNPKKARPAGRFSRPDVLLTGTSIIAVSGRQSGYADCTRKGPAGNARHKAAGGRISSSFGLRDRNTFKRLRFRLREADISSRPLPEG